MRIYRELKRAGLRSGERCAATQNNAENVSAHETRHGCCNISGSVMSLAGSFMSSRLDAYLGMHAHALRLSAKRTEVLAQNLANADTPNYKARDMDFQSALAAAMGSGKNSALPMKTTNQAHVATPGAAPGPDPFLKYRTPLAPALDGNTVDPQLEQAAFAQNAVRYEAELMFVGGMFKSLIRAITGQNNT